MGRQLASFGSNTYTYNEDGIRTSKTSNGVTTKFYLDGTNIIEQRTGTDVIHFYYDGSDEIIGFTYGENDYFYVKNAMGDITGITDINGNLVASYTYDAWGKVLSVTGSNAELGNLNPFRYRSYYYDVETELYYLQSRYYDPEVGRFINSDDVSFIGATGSEISYNPFAYCENNPVNDSDPSGNAKNNANKNILVTTTIVVYLMYFLDYLFKGANYSIVGKKIKCNRSGIMSVKVRYKSAKKILKYFTVKFGNLEAWKDSSQTYNKQSSLYLDSYSQAVYDEGSKASIPQAQEEIDPLYIGIMTTVYFITYANFKVKASKATKVYNAVWGSKGVDPRGTLRYFAFLVSGDKKYNGTYAISPRYNRRYKL